MNVRDQVKDRSRGMCEARIEDICTGRASQVHHRKLRSQGGKDTALNLIHLCNACHDYAHAHPAWAKENGLIIPIGKVS